MNVNPLYEVTLAGVQTSGEWLATVHSIFDKAINIIVDGKRFTLLFNPLWISENNIVISDRAFGALIDYSSVISSDRRFIFINDMPVAEYKNARLWRMPEFDHSPILPNALDKLKMFLEQSETNQVLRYIENGFIDVASHFACGQATDFSKIIGAGLGLTPSGDDMLVGFALAVQYQSPELLPKLADLCLPLLRNTTDISRYLLADALSGKFISPLVELILALKSGQNIDNAISIAANIGSSSGRDGIFGLYNGLKLLNA